MSTKRKCAYLISGILFTIASIFLALNISGYSLVLSAAISISCLGKPKDPPKPFWTGSLSEWLQIAFIILVTVGFALFIFFQDPGALPADKPSRFDNPVYRSWFAFLAWTVVMGVQWHHYRVERRRPIQPVNRTETATGQPQPSR